MNLLAAATLAVFFYGTYLPSFPATGMGDLGIPTWVIGLVLNHNADGGHLAAKARGIAALVTARYDRSRRETEIKTALQAWGDRLDQILRGHEVPDNVRQFRA